MSTPDFRECPHDAPDTGANEHAAVVSRLFREHNRLLVGFLYARLRNESEAKEIAQEAYVKLLQLDDPKASNFLRAYLFRVAENLALDRIRQRQVRSRVEQLSAFDELLAGPSAERGAIAKEELALLEQAVSELPPKCRQAFRLHKLEDRPLGEVASLMRVSERMVRKHICRALVYVRLRREGTPPADAAARLNLP